MFSKEPDDEFFETMDPIKKLWLYESWIHEQELEMEKDKNHAILTGSFYNPEAARKIIQKENPQYRSTEEDFEKTWAEIEKSVQEEELNKKINKRKRKKRKIIK